jgi:hypothetical protein
MSQPERSGDLTLPLPCLDHLPLPDINLADEHVPDTGLLRVGPNPAPRPGDLVRVWLPTQPRSRHNGRVGVVTVIFNSGNFKGRCKVITHTGPDLVIFPASLILLKRHRDVLEGISEFTNGPLRPPVW